MKTYEERRDAVTKVLEENPKLTDKQIAESCGVIPKLVEMQRNFLGIAPAKKPPKQIKKERFVEPITDPDFYFGKNGQGDGEKTYTRTEQIIQIANQGLSINIASERLNLSVRQIQYNMKAYGMSYRQLLKKAKKQD